jgi:ectoine hydroxylase-related dioxygenase (phytanoyl-CoA dioxygenase family)
MITKENIDFFNKYGYVVIKKFYDFEEEIVPIQLGIYKILGLLLKKYKINVQQDNFKPNNFDKGYKELIAKNRSYGGEVYDAIKQIPSFIRLVSAKKNESLYNQIRNTNHCGISAQGYGIRIDNPNEEKYRSLWHFEYRDQFRSKDGIVFWSPLVPIKLEMGPVIICPGSHKGGLRRSFLTDPENPDKTGVYALRLENEEEVVKKYGIVQPLSNPGDLVLMDFLTIHSSGKNISNKSRWSMQYRIFNFEHQSGIDISWKGVSNNLKLEEIHPELVVKNK